MIMIKNKNDNYNDKHYNDNNNDKKTIMIK